MITIGNTEFYSKEEIIEALKYIKEKRNTQSMKYNLAFDRFRYVGEFIIKTSLNELPNNTQIGDMILVAWPNDHIHYRDALDNSISSRDLLVYSSVGWVKYNPENFV